MLRRRMQLSCAVAALIVGSACATPKITKRYDSRTFTGSASDSDVALSVFATDVPSTSAQTTLTSLPERAQMALIQALNAKSSDTAALLKALGSPIPKPPPPNRIVDRTRVERRVVFSIENRSKEPADRIHRATVKLSLPEAAKVAQFRSWNQFATKYGTVNLGSVKFTQTREAGLEVKAEPPQVKELTEVKGSAKAVQNLEETLNIQQRFVELTGALTPQEARLVQEGAFGIDLTGNLLVDVTLAVGGSAREMDVFAFRNLSIDAKPENKPVIERQTIRYVAPDVCTPVNAAATLESVLRLARRGDSTLMEGDDEAEYRTGTSEPVTVELVPREALQVSVWFLVDKANRPLHIAMREEGRPEVLALGSADDAVALLDYLNATTAPAAVGGRSLSIGGQPLTRELARGLQFEIQKLNWTTGGCADPTAPKSNDASEAKEK
jgi:hypothetical protein